MKNNPEIIKKMGDNARKYAEQHDYIAFCKTLYNAIVIEKKI